MVGLSPQPARPTIPTPPPPPVRGPARLLPSDPRRSGCDGEIALDPGRWLAARGRVGRRGRPGRLRPRRLAQHGGLHHRLPGQRGGDPTPPARRAMGPAAYDAFFETFDEVFLDPGRCGPAGIHGSELGAAADQLPPASSATPRRSSYLESGFRLLDRVIDLLASRGIHTIIDLHAAPGYQNHHWHSDNPTHQALFWQHPHFQDRVIRLWEAIADRYRDRPEVAGYNPLNEPADESGEVLPLFYERLVAAIRAHGPAACPVPRRQPLLHRLLVLPRAVRRRGVRRPRLRAAGMAASPGYPDTVRGEHVDREALELTFLRRTEFMRRTGTPIWIGEFGPVYPPDHTRAARLAPRRAAGPARDLPRARRELVAVDLEGHRAPGPRGRATRPRRTCA